MLHRCFWIGACAEDQIVLQLANRLAICTTLISCPFISLNMQRQKNKASINANRSEAKSVLLKVVQLDCSILSHHCDIVSFLFLFTRFNTSHSKSVLLKLF